MEYPAQHSEYELQDGGEKVAGRGAEACDDAAIRKDTQFFEDF